MKNEAPIASETTQFVDERGKLTVPKTDRALTKMLDFLYLETKEKMQKEELPFRDKGFNGLVEIIASEAVIMKAVEKLKQNSGSMTPGVDNKTIRNFLNDNLENLLKFVRKNLKFYNPGPVRRKWIDKPGKKDKRPLGIPDIGDRIVQECVRIVIEPILEAQFFKHSYGFRPYRSCQQAYCRLADIIYKTGNFWVVEGDIKGFFDNVNHTVLIKQLYAMGIKDKRLLMLIKAMLKSGVMDETETSTIGTPQGGIISPLLANAYLHKFDTFITREWEDKKLQNPNKPEKDGRSKHFQQMRKIKTGKWGEKNKKQKFKTSYLVRYADDWVIITDSKENAEKLKYRAEKFLKDRLKIELSKDKTLITDVRVRAAKFLGYELKFRYKGNVSEAAKIGQHGYVVQSKPDSDRLKTKMKELREDIKRLKKCKNLPETVHQINIINSVINGLHNYYNVTTLVNKTMANYSYKIHQLAYRILQRKHNGFLIAANQTDNQQAKHQKEDDKKLNPRAKEYTGKVPAIKLEGKTIGITKLSFVRCKFNKNYDMKNELKVQDETKYSRTGRELYQKRAKKKLKAEREDELLKLDLSLIITSGRNKTSNSKKYNLEYMLNRARAYNISGGTCKCCKRTVGMGAVPFHVHHIKPWLPLREINKTKNLTILCVNCHKAVHNNLKYLESDIFWHIDFNGFCKITKLRRELIPPDKK